MPEPPKTVRELSIAIALRDENINLQLQAINTNILKLTESIQQLSASKADKDDLERLMAQVASYEMQNSKMYENISNTYVTKREAGVGATVLTITISAIGFVLNLIKDWRAS